MTVAIDGFESSAIFAQIHSSLSGSAADKENAMKKVKSVFQFDVKVKINRCVYKRIRMERSLLGHLT
jgi:hypothetical protein